MPASTIAGTRSTLASAFSGLAATSYAYVPESPIPPAIVIVPSSPYMEQQLINKSTLKVKINFVITAIVAYNSNPASLDNLEQLIIGILAAMPAGYVVGNVEKPVPLEVGASTMLCADINISTTYTQTN
jgi:hypothetical protein